MPGLLSLDLLLVAAAAWLLIGLVGLFAGHRPGLIAGLLFPAGALVGLGVGVVGFTALGAAPQSALLAIGLPDLPFHLRLDNLSAVFALLLGFAGAGISVYAAGYFGKGDTPGLGPLCFEYHLFLASMLMVLLADDAYAFMVAWECMALSSFFLVTTDHKHEEIRNAGFLYLLIAHIGAIGILLSFGVMTGGAGDYSFAAMRAQELSPAFVLPSGKRGCRNIDQDACPSMNEILDGISCVMGVGIPFAFLVLAPQIFANRDP